MKPLIAAVFAFSLLGSATALAAPDDATAPVAAAQTPAVAGNAGPAATDARGHNSRQVHGPRHGDRRSMRHAHDRRHAHGHPRHGKRPLAHAGLRGHEHGHGPRGQRIRLGAPLAEDRQGVVVSEHRRHGLQKAPRGQEWRRIGERYVRVTSGSNVVNEIVINGL